MSGFIPESIGNLKNLTYLGFRDNQLTGSIPESIGDLEKLNVLTLDSNKLAGEIPESVGNLSHLTRLYFSNNQLVGPIPESIGNIENIESIRLEHNQLTGTIPESLATLMNLKLLHLEYNQLGGVISDFVMQSKVWRENWMNILDGNNYDVSKLYIPAPKFDSITTISGDTISDSIFAKNELTVLYWWASWCPNCQAFTPKLMNWYNKYKDKGLDVLSYSTEDIDVIKEFILEYGLQEWNTFRYSSNDNPEFNLQYLYVPTVNVVDKNGTIIFNGISDNHNDLGDFLADYFAVESDDYISTDFSADGKVRQIQTATVGNGIDVVLMGDAYSDREIAAGDYDADIERSVEALFSEEPYKSFRDHFNVYAVTAVSKNEGYVDGGSTVFEGFFGEGTHVGGNDNTALNYARKVIPDERVDEAVVIVMMNRDYYAGTCYMYGSDYVNDYGGGVSVSYFPASSYYEEFRGTILHEAFGHGFAKLDDEYAYEHYGEIPSAEIEKLNRLYLNYGWSKNVDVTDDPAQVKWRHFLEDPRYSADGLGVFEGAATYWSGVWRPTENSIMRYNTGGFNAPSREAIYYRIHKLAYGEEWQYDYEEFVEYDAINRNKTATRSEVPYRPEEPENFRHCPPIVYNYSWREMMNNSK